MFCNPDITCRQVSLDCILKRFQMLERLLVGHMVIWSYGHIVSWSVGLLVTTNQLTNTPINHYLLVITDHMTNIIQTG